MIKIDIFYDYTERGEALNSMTENIWRMQKLHGDVCKTFKIYVKNAM